MLRGDAGIGVEMRQIIYDDSTKYSKEVTALLEAVSQKLGRQAIVRQVKNQDEWIILDIAFSYFQKADRNRQVGYRSGFSYFIDESDRRLMFKLVHTPIMFQFLHDNFNFEIFRDIVINTSKYRDFQYFKYKLYNTEKIGKFYGGTFDTITELLKEIDFIEEHYGFVKTLFSKNNASKAGLGNTFYLDVANGDKLNVKNIPGIIDAAWPLFMWLYPSKPLFARDATLNRAMKHIQRECEISKVKELPKTIAHAMCNGIIQAAHIMPHHLGDNDKLSNGIWLCEKHHRLTEGHLSGSRTIDDTDISFE